MSTTTQAAGPSKDLTLQLYAAAHLVTATPPENVFLDNLSRALALDPALVAQLNATASALAPPAR